MAGDSTSMVKIMNPHPLKIDVVEFDDKKNFEMWRCEVMDALTTSNVEDTQRLEKKRETTSEEEWEKMSRTAYGLIRSCLTQDIMIMYYMKPVSYTHLTLPTIYSV